MAGLPQEVEQWEREKRRENIIKYRDELDKGVNEKNLTKLRTIRDNSGAFYPKTPDNHHNPLYNPLPYNIQNPYIMRELRRNGLTQQTPAGYFAGVAASNLEPHR